MREVWEVVTNAKSRKRKAPEGIYKFGEIQCVVNLQSTERQKQRTGIRTSIRNRNAFGYINARKKKILNTATGAGAAQKQE